MIRSSWIPLVVLAAGTVHAADVPKDSPFTQAGANAASAPQGDDLEFGGVSTVGKKTMINLYDKQDKHGFWVEEGGTMNGVTVVKYDIAHDQVTIRRNGAEKVLALRPPSTVVNGPATPVPAAPAPAAGVAAASTPTPTATTPQARQEEEARMLVSDLLEIGMAQRKAYEEAQKKAASSQPPAGQTTAGNATAPAAAGGTPSTPPTASTPSSTP